MTLTEKARVEGLLAMAQRALAEAHDLLQPQGRHVGLARAHVADTARRAIELAGNARVVLEHIETPR